MTAVGNKYMPMMGSTVELKEGRPGSHIKGVPALSNCPPRENVGLTHTMSGMVQRFECNSVWIARL